MEKSSAQSFYDALSADYDSMIGFDSSLVKRITSLKKFILPGDKTAADLGCGSGLDSIALSRLGLNVTGFDISESMIEAASANAVRLEVNAEFHSYAINKIPKQFNNKYSFALSLGNSLANINRTGLTKSLSKMFSLLQPGGHILIQILNYNRILSAKERIVGITERGNCIYIRFYDFENEKTFFNILRIERGEKTKHSLITTEIFPYKSNEITGFIKDAGFKNIKKFGGLNQSKFSAGLSQDLVITAFK